MTKTLWAAPASWQWAELGDIAEIVGGGTPAAGDPMNFSEHGIPWLTPADLSRNRETYTKGGTRCLSQKGYDSSGAQLIPKGAVLFSSRAPIGYCVIAERPLCTNQGFKSLVLHDGLVPEYVRHYLLASKSYAESEASGTTFLELSGARMRTLSLPVAPTAEQMRIVAKVDELTTRSRRAKEALDAVPPLLERLRQSILAAAFRGDLTADWRAQNPNVESSDKLIARIRAERRMRWETTAVAAGRSIATYREPTETVPDDVGTPLPDGWAWVTAEDCAWDITVGYVGPMKHRYVSEGIPFLRSQNVRENRFSREGLLHIPEDFHRDLKKSALRPGDLVVVRSGAPGTACVIPTELPDANCSDLVICRLVPSVLPELLCFFVNSQYAKTQVLDAQVGVAQQHFNIGAMRKLVVPLMPVEEQKVLLDRVATAFRALARLEDALEQSRRHFSDLDSAILAKAFRGDLVPQDSDDEPASGLLGRIRVERDSAEAARPRTRRKAEEVVSGADDDDEYHDAIPIRSESATATSHDLRMVEHETLLDEVAAALWTLGPLEKADAVRRAADHFREAGYVQFERLRTDGPLFGQVLDAIDSAVKAGRLDRPKRGHVRACKGDAATYTADDWRHAVVASLGSEPTDREEAIRAAAEWARDNMGLEFTRLRGDGHIVEGLRSAINSAIRRGDVIRHNSTHISRAGAVQPALLSKGRFA